MDTKFFWFRNSQCKVNQDMTGVIKCYVSFLDIYLEYSNERKCSIHYQDEARQREDYTELIKFLNKR